MDLAQVPSTIGALIVLAFGVVIAIKPRAIETVGVTASTALGWTEVRSVFGGMFIAMGAACLITQHPYVYLTVGSIWLGDALVRVFALFVDRPKFTEGLAVLVAGIVIGGLLLTGFWTR